MGWSTLETARIEAGIPRFPVDMDATHFPQECGIESRAVSYTKGCYIGQEILNRLHTMGHVNRRLCGFWLGSELRGLPAPGDKLFASGGEAGFITSTADSPVFRARIALGYARREIAPGTELLLRTQAGETTARVAELPFAPPLAGAAHGA